MNLVPLEARVGGVVGGYLGDAAVLELDEGRVDVLVLRAGPAADAVHLRHD